VQIRVRDRNHEAENEIMMTENYTIVNKPKAFFNYSQLTLGDRVEFYASQSGAKNERIIYDKWNFGDGDISSINDNYTWHYYKKGGVYNVTLTVANDKDVKDSISRDVNVTSNTSYQIKVKTKNVEHAQVSGVSVYLILHCKYS